MAYMIDDPEDKPQSPEWMFVLGLLFGADAGWLPFTTKRNPENCLNVVFTFPGCEIEVFDDSGWDYVALIKVGGTTINPWDDNLPDESLLVRDFRPKGELLEAFRACEMEYHE